MRTLALLLVLMLLAAPLAAADETQADCEDGQDYVGYRPTQPLRHAVENATGDTLFATACEGEQWDGQDSVDEAPLFEHQLGRDPNTARGDDLLDPLGVRVTAGNGEVYAATNVALLARVAIYAGTCGEGDDGLEGDASCGGTRELRTGLYARDNTPGNALATMAECLVRITCFVSEADCDHATYVHGRLHPPSECSRDNTAFGLMLVLP